MVKPNYTYIERLVEQLPLPLKLRLVERLQAETRKVRWNKLLQSIDRKLNGRRYTMDEINAEIAAVRQSRRRHARLPPLRELPRDC